MRKEDIWAVDSGRIRTFFQEQPDITQTESGFVFHSCRVSVTALEPRRMAGMTLPPTRIVFEGEEWSVIPIYRRFLLRFLSAGG